MHFQDPDFASSEKLGKIISLGRTPVIQFAEAPELATLKRANDFCREFGADLQIRFYSFGWKEFDTSLLRHLPQVANLSIDTIRAISDFSPIAELPALTRLRFGVHDHPDGKFLEQLDLGRFTHLTLAENKRRNFDLAPLRAATSLEQLFVQGHHRGIDAISSLPLLTDVSLSGFPKRRAIAILNDLAALRSLTLLLGSRTSIAEFVHSGLQKLKIVWVRELEEIGPLRRFSNLEDLEIEDQLRLETLDISDVNLRRLIISNCKNLRQIIGIEQQNGLEQKSIHGTKMLNVSE